MNQLVKTPPDVVGWGVDANPRNDPTYPMKKRTDAEQAGYTWDRPWTQETDIEVLQSPERPNVSAVFGTSVPPSGVSGSIRRFAFRFSESSNGHWFPLMLADRVNMVEGLLHDLARGRVPNVFAEMGWRAEWRYNRRRFLLRRTIDVLVIGAIVGILRRRGAARRTAH